MEFNDLRSWIKLVESIGDLKYIDGADWDVEIGALLDMVQRKIGRPALLFDHIKGYPEGFRVLGNVLTSTKRIAISLGLPLDASSLDLIHRWRKILKDPRLIPPRTVEDGPVLENVNMGDEVDLFKFPVPKWHEQDGGRYIGTGCMVIQKDPDSDWVNLGTYRVVIHDSRTAGLYITLGRHGDMIMRRYWQKGEPCPVAVTIGQDPLTYMLAGAEIPYGICEYDLAGGISGKPVEVIRGITTGLPIPAHCEIVIEGEIPPEERLPEGPFGEWTGYYSGGRRPNPIIKVKSICYRNDPIIMGALPGIPPNDDCYYGGFFGCAAVWNEMENAGVPGIMGVWAPEAGGGIMMLTVSIKQLYPGHSRQAGLIASQCHARAYANRMVVVVDEDIDPYDINQVLWAMCTRMDPRDDVEIIKKCWSSPLDPMSYPEDLRIFNSRMIIDACISWDRKNKFPPKVEVSQEWKRRILEKYHDLFT